MISAWRLVKRRHVESAFNGEGARQHGGRWNSPGTAVVYASESRALCLLEVLAGIRSVKTIDAYVLIPVTFDKSIVVSVDLADLPETWLQSPPHPFTQQIGDVWADEKRSAVLRVPSIIVPAESNYLLNPAHSDFMRIAIGKPEALSVDSRLVR